MVYIATHHKDFFNPDISFNEFLEGDSNEESRAAPSSNCSLRSSDSINDRPLSIMSNGTVKSSGSKSRFNFFSNKEKRNSISLSFSSSKSKRSPMTSPTAPTFQTASNDFDDLIRSGNTKKVSLTPNRLRSIEIKDDVTPWERFSTSSKINQKQKKRATSPPPPLPPLPRLNRDDSPPLTPASSVASRPSQKSRHSIIYEDKPNKSSIKSYSTHEDLLVDETTNLMRNPSKMSTSGSLYSNHSRMSTSGSLYSKDEKVKPRFERPSSMVVKRASMGSRPPSFHENVFMDVNGNILMAAAAGSVETTSKTFDDLRQQYEKRNPPIKKNEEQDMIYVIPSIPSRSQISGNHRNHKPRTVDRGCQTDTFPLHALTLEEQEEDEEEWFIEEEEWEDHAEEEKVVAEWLLGNV